MLKACFGRYFLHLTFIGIMIGNVDLKLNAVLNFNRIIMKKLMILGLVAIGLASCSEDTIDNIGRDTALNIIRSNSWNNVVHTEFVGGKEVLRDTLVGEGKDAKLDFNKDGFAYMFDGKGGTKSVAYEMPNSKTMIFGGTTYNIQENIVTTVVKFSMENVTAGKTSRYEFKRR